MARNRHRFNRPPEINMTSMIDVMSLLMCVTLVTAPLLSTGVDVNLPRGGRQALSGPDKGLDIAIDKDGSIYIGREKVELRDLGARLKDISKANPDISIVLSGDAAGRYGRVVEVMAELKAMGFSKVGLKMEPATGAR